MAIESHLSQMRKISYTRELLRTEVVSYGKYLQLVNIWCVDGLNLG